MNQPIRVKKGTNEPLDIPAGVAGCLYQGHFVPTGDAKRLAEVKQLPPQPYEWMMPGHPEVGRLDSRASREEAAVFSARCTSAALDDALHESPPPKR